MKVEHPWRETHLENFRPGLVERPDRGGGRALPFDDQDRQPASIDEQLTQIVSLLSVQADTRIETSAGGAERSVCSTTQ